MGKMIFNILWALTILFVPNVAFAERDADDYALTQNQATSTDQASVEMILSFAVSDGVLVHYDKARGRLIFERATLCIDEDGQYMGGVCRIFIRDTYYLDVEHRHIAHLYSEQVDGAELWDVAVSSEDKMLEVYDYVLKDGFFDELSRQRISKVLEIGFAYKRLPDPNSVSNIYKNYSRLNFYDSDGRRIAYHDFEGGTLHSVHSVPSQSFLKKYFIADTRSCGASSCAGAIKVLQLTMPKD